MAESIASPRRVSMTGSITWNSKKQGVDQAGIVCIDILNFVLDLRYDIEKNKNLIVPDTKRYVVSTFSIGKVFTKKADFKCGKCVGDQN